MRLAIFLLAFTLSAAAQADDVTLQQSAAAQADDVALQQKVFGHTLGDKEAGYACFTKAYDKDHLASHPRQNVTSIMLLLERRSPVSEPVDVFNPISVTGDFRFRKSGKHFQAWGGCFADTSSASALSASALHCGIDCDGGSINVDLKDANTVLVKMPYGIAVGGSGSTVADEPSKDHFGSDDTVFKLSRAPVVTCLPLGILDEDKAAMKKAK